MTFSFRLNRYGKVSKTKTIQPDKTYLFNFREKSYDPHAFGNFVDAQNVLVVFHALDNNSRKSFSNVVAIRGRNLKAQQEISGIKYARKGVLDKQFRIGCG